MSIAKVNGIDYTVPPNRPNSGSNNDGGLFVQKSTSTNMSSVNSANNTKKSSTVVSGVNTSIAFSGGIFANDSRIVGLQITNKIAGVNTNAIINTSNINKSVPAQNLNPNLTTNPVASKRRVKNYSFDASESTSKTATAIREGKWNYYTGKFETNYPVQSNEYWTNISTNNLSLLWDAKDYSGSGTLVTDSSGRNNSGILTNGVSYSITNNIPKFIFNSSSGSYIDSSFTIGESDPVTIGAFMKASGGQNIGLVGFRSSWGSYVASGIPTISQCLLYVTGDENAVTNGTGFSFSNWDGRIIGGSFKSVRNSTVFALTKNVCDNKWHQLVGVKSPTHSQVWLDGELISEKLHTSGLMPRIYPGSDSGIPKFLAGVAGNGTGVLANTYFNGEISHAFCYNKALTEREIKQNYYSFINRYRDYL